MHGEVVDVFGRDPADICGFVVGAQGTADQFGGEAERELLAYFTVGVFDDVVRIGVHPDERGDRDVEAGLFTDFPDGAVGDGFAEFKASAG